jgi:hypothetical protein
MIISFPKYHFYPEFSGQAILHWIFYILHFHNHEFMNFFSPRRSRVSRGFAEIVDTAHCSPLTRERGWGWGKINHEFTNWFHRGEAELIEVSQRKSILPIAPLSFVDFPLRGIKVAWGCLPAGRQGGEVKKTALLPEKRFQKKIIIQWNSFAPMNFPLGGLRGLEPHRSHRLHLITYSHFHHIHTWF